MFRVYCYVFCCIVHYIGGWWCPATVGCSTWCSFACIRPNRASYIILLQSLLSMTALCPNDHCNTFWLLVCTVLSIKSWLIVSSSCVTVPSFKCLRSNLFLAIHQLLWGYATWVVDWNRILELQCLYTVYRHDQWWRITVFKGIFKHNSVAPSKLNM